MNNSYPLAKALQEHELQTSSEEEEPEEIPDVRKVVGLVISNKPFRKLKEAYGKLNMTVSKKNKLEDDIVIPAKTKEMLAKSSPDEISHESEIYIQETDRA